MSKILLLLPLFFSSLCLGMYDQLSVNADNFSVFDGKALHSVKSYDIDKSLRMMDKHQLQSFLAQGGKIRASKLNNGEYVLRAHVPGLGGGPIVGVLTAIGTFTLTGIATVGAAAGGFVVGGPVGAVGAAVATANAGVAASAYATAGAFALPTP
jgi:hypothetical protein